MLFYNSFDIRFLSLSQAMKGTFSISIETLDILAPNHIPNALFYEIPLLRSHFMHPALLRCGSWFLLLLSLAFL